MPQKKNDDDEGLTVALGCFGATLALCGVLLTLAGWAWVGYLFYFWIVN